MAIGLVSFSLLAILGLLPIGLGTVREAIAQSAEAGIARQLRSAVQQVPLLSVQALDGETFLYNRQGMKVDAASQDAYFEATLDVAPPVITGASTNFPSAAQVVKVDLAYPHAAPAAGRQTNSFSLLVARP